MIKAIITDLDATILPTGGHISEKTIERLEKLGEKGIIRILATGRNMYTAKIGINKEDFPIDYLVFSAGAGIINWKTKELLSKINIPQDEAQHIAKILIDKGFSFMIHKKIPDNHKLYYHKQGKALYDFEKRIDIFKEIAEPISSHIDIKDDVSEFIIVSKDDISDDIQNLFHKYSIIKSSSPTGNDTIWVEIFNAKVNKANGCRKVLSSIGINIEEEAMGIGNDYNDIHFLRECKDAAVVGNAPRALIDEFRCVRSDIDGGFLEFTETLL